jgi:S1-C subfamily serine protease
MKTALLLAVFLLFGSACGVLNAQETHSRSSEYSEVTTRSPRRAWLGVFIRDITNELKEDKNIKIDKGAYISSVIDESPADSIGLKEGDVILSFNGKSIDDAAELVHAMEKAKPGTKASLEIMRNGDRKTFAVILGSQNKFNNKKFFVFSSPQTAFVETNVLGMKLSTLNKQLAEYFGAPDNKGVLVESVRRKCPAEKSGVKAGDVITNIQDERIQNVGDVHQALNDAESGQIISMNIIRKGEKKTLKLKVPEDFDSANFPPAFENMSHFPAMKDFHFTFPNKEDFDDIPFNLQKELNPEMKELCLRLKGLENIGKSWRRNSNEI